MNLAKNVESQFVIMLCRLIAICLNVFFICRRESIARDRKDRKYIQDKAYRENTIIANVPQHFLFSVHWRQATSNSWGVFALTHLNTIVVFDHKGKALAEFFLPTTSFQNFFADDDTLTLIDMSGNALHYSFWDIKWYAANSVFGKPEASEKCVRLAECTRNSVIVHYATRKSRFHYATRKARFYYACILPEWILVLLDALAIVSWISLRDIEIMMR